MVLDAALIAIEKGADGERQVVTLAGELDIATVPEVERRLKELLAAGPLILDLRGVTFAGARSISLLLTLNEWAVEHRTWLEVREPSEIVRRVVRLAGVQHLLDPPRRSV